MEDVTDHIEEKCKDFHGAMITLILMAARLAVVAATALVAIIAAMLRQGSIDHVGSSRITYA